eukprot:TRINITY_DN68467_c0_g1_i1.p1 TRINITY_DN68467_c0_g1~~TRINITY_DN68467_c0_g1_i1.p1  ORF type:complete len:290 (+),score=61.21 TRINITY_DN68467_c0_g1_i1:32-901(+)
MPTLLMGSKRAASPGAQSVASSSSGGALLPKDFHDMRYAIQDLGRRMELLERILLFVDMEQIAAAIHQGGKAGVDAMLSAAGENAALGQRGIPEEGPTSREEDESVSTASRAEPQDLRHGSQEGGSERRLASDKVVEAEDTQQSTTEIYESASDASEARAKLPDDDESFKSLHTPSSSSTSQGKSARRNRSRREKARAKAGIFGELEGLYARVQDDSEIRINNGNIQWPAAFNSPDNELSADGGNRVSMRAEGPGGSLLKYSAVWHRVEKELRWDDGDVWKKRGPTMQL